MSRGKILLEAYVEKRKINDNRKLEASKEFVTIKSLSPIRQISPSRSTTQLKVQDKWWQKSPAVAGEACNEVQKRLSDTSTFTGIYKQRFEEAQSWRYSNFDYVEDPVAARKLLLNSSYKDLTIPGRAGDFKNEIEWRLSLRPA